MKTELVEHTGTERYVVLLDVSDQEVDLPLPYGAVGAKFRVTSVRLVWERERGGGWKRQTMYYRGSGSSMSGPRINKGGKLSDSITARREVFDWDGNLTSYAAKVPGLADYLTDSVRLPE